MSLHNLTADKYPQALALIERGPLTYFAIVARAIAEGNCPGSFWADADDNPASILMWDGGVICGLAGDADKHPEGTRFNDAVSDFVAEHIIPKVLPGQPFLKVYYAPNDWEARAIKLSRGATISKVERRLS